MPPTVKWACSKIDYLRIGLQKAKPDAEEMRRAEDCVAKALKAHKREQWILWGGKRTP